MMRESARAVIVVLREHRRFVIRSCARAPSTMGVGLRGSLCYGVQFDGVEGGDWQDGENGHFVGFVRSKC